VRPKFARANYFPAGWETDLSRFVGLFHRYGYIYRPLSGGTWASANDRWSLTDTEIIKAISLAHDKFLLGARAGKHSQFAVIDIDAGSKYHNKKQLEKLLKALDRSGLTRSTLFRSSDSEGWHLYLFFDEPINSAELHRYLVALLKLNDFVVSKGTLEVFPNPGKNSQGMGLRLPLQHGFAWLDKQTLDVDYYREQMTATKALTYFLDLLDSYANSFKAFRQLKAHVLDLESKREHAKLPTNPASNVVPLRSPVTMPDNDYGHLVTTVFGHLPSGMNVEDWCRGRQFSIEGLTGPKQRAEAIFCLNHYLFYGDPSRNLHAMGYGFEEERDWAVKEFLEARHNGQSEDISRGRADALEQSARAAHWRPPSKRDAEPRTYTAVRPISWIRANANKKRDARNKIQEALDSMKKLGRSFTTVELEECADVSRRTLYKHEDIWRQDYEDLAAGFFASCVHEYNAVVEAASSESLPPSTVSQKITPPGLLAARRIVAEISMRAQRDIRKSVRQKESVQDDTDKAWRAKVAVLTTASPPTLSIGQIKALLFVLPGYLSVAPYEEDATALLPYVQQLRRELAGRAGPPQSNSE
jgi:hypothetical protein